MRRLEQLRVKIFADGADLPGIVALARNPLIKGFTTNPTLMRAAGVVDYEAFARALVAAIPDRPVSLEVFSDEFDEMAEQARRIASWGRNVAVKIPVMNTRGESSVCLIRDLAASGVRLNVTALMSLPQVREVNEALAVGPPSFISIFAGRVADSGRDPLPLMAAARRIVSANPQIELIWASPRELFNIIQADDIGCHAITVSHDLLKKLPLIGKDLHEFSRETVQMFRDDALKAGYRLAHLASVAEVHARA